ncbi:MAG: S41 family peptidase [Oscillospiraceae bacterium]|nr:S41 family peptidase [Oscillospiraceae bacterium]
MNKKISLGLALSIATIACTVTFIITSFFSLQNFNKKVVDVKEKAEKYQQLESIDTYVRENFLHEIDEEKLGYGILKGYISGLDDKYSQYLTPAEYQDMLADDSGKIVGLGITVSEDASGYLTIASIMVNSPVSQSVLEIGDIIVAVDGKDVLEMGVDDAIASISGTAGSDVEITIRRDGKDIPLKFTRQTIEITSVTSRMLDDYIGYIKISSFRGNTPEQFHSELERLTMNGAKALIIDLRNNGGGLLSSLEKCIDPLLPEGVIAIEKYKDEHTETLIYSDESELNIPMTVIVNGKTASAAELFAVSLRDFKNSAIVGEQTYGKGVIQVTKPFDDGSAVALTIAEYQTTVSECFDGTGITPDYITVQSNDEIDTTDYQLDKAFEVTIEKLSEN